jgi:hypothetical protein
MNGTALDELGGQLRRHVVRTSLADPMPVAEPTA